jgi:hypothetical protein
MTARLVALVALPSAAFIALHFALAALPSLAAVLTTPGGAG